METILRQTDVKFNSDTKNKYIKELKKTYFGVLLFQIWDNKEISRLEDKEALQVKIRNLRLYFNSNSEGIGQF